jgi:hypothetical protein
MTDIISDVKKLQLPVGKYSVVGGSALAARGIREAGDIDLIVTEDLYEKLKADGWEEKEKKPDHYHLYKGNVEVAKSFAHIERCKLQPENVIGGSEIINGVPFMSLNDLLELKRAMAREKDLRDIRLIENYLGR